MIVWVLVMALGYHTGDGSIVIDNIATKADCQALAAVVQRTLPRAATYSTTNQPGPPREAACIAVRKVKGASQP